MSAATLSVDGWFSIAVVVATLVALAATRIAADVVLCGALAVLILPGVLEPAAALAGFASDGLATVAVLFVVVSGLLETGAVQSFALPLLGQPRSVAAAQARLMLPIALASAFLNNTPLVALSVPAVEAWCRRIGLPVSRLMLPLSYAAILGGTCTLIGTSTNLMVHGMVIAHGMAPLGLFEIAAVGVPCALVGIAFVVLASPWLLPLRTAPLERAGSAREYAVELIVGRASPLIGKRIAQAGLRHLPGVFLAEIERRGTLLAAVSPDVVLERDDRLLFVGAVDAMPELLRQRGLTPAPEQVFKLGASRAGRRIVEVVVAAQCPLAGTSIREGAFRNRYDAVVLAVAREGEQLRGRIGDIVLRAGDVLLLEARAEFAQQHAGSRDFLLVSALDTAPLPRHERAFVALGILALMVASVAMGWLDMLSGALLAAGAMLVTRCSDANAARRAIDWPVLIVIGASLALGRALQDSGAALYLARGWLALAGDSPWLTLAAVYVLTSLMTEVVTNNAAAALVFPLAVASAEALQVSPTPFVIAIMMAASASFATPVGYQTNLMVYGPGGYRFTDFLRIGVPMNLLMGVVAIGVIPRVWPF